MTQHYSTMRSVPPDALKSDLAMLHPAPLVILPASLQLSLLCQQLFCSLSAMPYKMSKMTLRLGQAALMGNVWFFYILGRVKFMDEIDAADVNRDKYRLYWVDYAPVGCSGRLLSSQLPVAKGEGAPAMARGGGG